MSSRLTRHLCGLDNVVARFTEIDARKVVTIFLSMTMAANFSLLMAGSAGAQSQPSTTGSSAPKGTLNFDLSSKDRSLAPPAALGAQGVDIKTGTLLRHVDTASMLTPAERLAVWQVISSGTQSILLSNYGDAVGGSLNLSQKFNFNISDLIIPKGVTTNDHASALNVLGNFNNFGTLNVSPALNSIASINADNIVNNVGALIAATSSLNLTAVQNIVNHGQISSLGNLNLIAGGSITNSAVNNSALSAIINAAGNLNLTANNIINSGTITSAAGNINIGSLIAGNILVNNTLGQLSALKGDINVRDLLFSGKHDLSIFGGNLLSKNLNVFSGNGDIDIQVNKLTGLVNASASNIHIGSSGSNLNLGTISFLEDPIFYNLNGSITINAPITGPSDTAPAVSIIASQDILSTSAGSINAPAFPVNVIAGAKIIVSGDPSAPSSQFPSTPPPPQGYRGPGTFTIYGPSSTGGKIDLSLLTSFSTAGNSGGTVSLVAYQGSSAGSGTIKVGDISTGATGAGAQNGNIVIIAGAKSDTAGGSALSTGVLTTATLANSVGGSVLLATGMPVLTAPLQIDWKGIQGTPSPSVGINSVNPGASITTGGVTGNIAPVTILAGNNVTVGGDITTTCFNPTVNFLAGNVSIYAGNSINFSTASKIRTNTSPVSAANCGGDVNLIAGAKYTPTVSHTFTAATGTSPQPQLSDTLEVSVLVTGASSTGGSITGLLSKIDSSAGAVSGTDGGTGGAVRLAAFAGASSPSTTGIINLGSTNISTAGSATSATTASTTSNVSGDVTILAGAYGVSGPTSITIGNVATDQNGIGAAGNGNQGGGNISIYTSAATGGLPFGYSYTVPNSGAPSPASYTGSLSPSGTLLTANINAGNLTAVGGSFNVGAPSNAGYTQTTNIDVRSGNNLTVGTVSNINNTLPTGTSTPSPLPSSTVNLYAVGNMTLNGNISSNAGSVCTVSGTPLGVDGGSVNITAGSFTLPAAVKVSADATGGYSPAVLTAGPPSSVAPQSGGNGGSISITTTNPVSGSVKIGSNAFQISAMADPNGGNAGSLTVKAATSISLDPTQMTLTPGANNMPVWNNAYQPLVDSGRGATINLTAGSTIAVSGNLDASGVGSSLNTGSVNTGSPGGSGGVISLTMNSSQPFNINGGSGATSNGINGNLTANGNVVATANNTASYGSGGSISVRNLGTGGVIIANGALQVQAAPATSVLMGQCCNPAAPAPPTPPSPGPNPPTPPLPDFTAYQIQQTYAGGTGGKIYLQGNTVLSKGNLDASGGASSASSRNSGSGGSIEIVTNSSAVPFVINPSTVLPPASSLYPIVSTNGIIGSLTANGNAGAAPSSAVAGVVISMTPTGNGGTLKVTNNAGGIVIATGAGMSVQAAGANQYCGTNGGNGGSIELNAKGPNGYITSAIGFNVDGGGECVPAAVNVNPLQTSITATDPATGTAQTIFVNSTTGLFVGQTVSLTGQSKSSPPSATIHQSTVIMRVYSNGTVVDTWGVYGTNTYYGPMTLQSYFAGGDGGAISIKSNSYNQLAINPATASRNSINGSLSARGLNGGSITVSNDTSAGLSVGANSLITTPVTIAPVVNVDIFGGIAGFGGNIFLSSTSGPVAVLGSLNVSGADGLVKGGLGGNISITSNSYSAFQVGASGPKIINGVIGTLQSNGGGSNSAAGGDAGSISIVNLSGAINAASASLVLTPGSCPNGQGNGGTLNLIAPQSSVFVAGGINLNGGISTNPIYASGIGGTLKIVCNSWTPFDVGAGTTNGTSGPISANGWSGGSIDITNLGFLGGIIVEAGQLTVSAAAANSGVTQNGQNVGGNGGSITLQAPSATVLIKGTAGTTSLSVDGGAQSAADNLPGGLGGQIAILTGAYSDFIIGGSTGITNGVIGNLSAQGQTGGVINISSAGTSSGGIVVNSSSNLNVGGYAGLVQTVSGSTFDFYGGKGGSIYLSATGLVNGRVFISGSGQYALNVDGGAVGTGPGAGNGGLISITTNSAQAFNIGNATAPGPSTPAGNGVGPGGGIFSAAGFNGGTIAIKNLGTGGIAFNPALISVSSASGSSASSTTFAGGNGGTIDLQAPNGPLGASSAGALMANATVSSQAGANGGTINLLGQTIVTANTLSVQVKNVLAGTGGNVFISQTGGTAALTLGNGTSLSISSQTGGASGPGGVLSINSAAGINIAGALSTSSNMSGTVTLTSLGSNGSIIQASGATITSGTLNLITSRGGTGPQPISSNVNQLAVFSEGGNVSISNAGALEVLSASAFGSNPAVPISMSIATQSGNLTVLQSGRGVISSGALTLSTASGNIIINNNVIGTNVTMSANGGISQGASTGTVSASGKLMLGANNGDITLNATATGYMEVNADASTNVSISNTGDLLYSMAASTGVTNFTLNNVGSINVKDNINMVTNVTMSTLRNQSIILNGNVGASGATAATSTVVLNAGGSIVEVGNAVIRGNSVTLSSQNGNLGLLTRSLTPTPSAAAPSGFIYNPSGAALNVDLVPNGVTPGTLSLSTQNTTDNSNPGTININIQASTLNPNGSASINKLNAGGDALISSTLNASGQLTLVNAASSTFGAITLSNAAAASTGQILINADITAYGGPVIIQNGIASANVASNIVVSNSVNLSGVAWFAPSLISTGAAFLPVNSACAVALLNGAFPASPTGGSTTPLASVTVNPTGLNVFYGNGLNVGSATINGAAATASIPAITVAFQGGGSNSISLGTSVVLNSSIGGVSGAPSSILIFPNMDLSSSTNNPYLPGIVRLTATTGSGLTGTFSLANPGGTLVFDPTTSGLLMPFSLSNLSAFNIPLASVTFANFSSSNPVAVNATSASGNARIGGTVSFSSPFADGRFFANSTVVSPVLNTTVSAKFLSDGNLTINAGGSVNIGGKLIAGNAGTGTGQLGLFTGQAAGTSSGIFAFLPAFWLFLYPPQILNSLGSSIMPAGTITLSSATVSAGQAGDGSRITFDSSNINATAGSFSANTINMSVGGSNYGLSSGVAVPFASARISGIGAIAANTLNLNAASGASISLGYFGNPNLVVNNLVFNALDSGVSFIQNSGFGVKGSTLGTLTLQSIGSYSPVTIGSISTLDNLTAGFVNITTGTLNNFYSITANGALGKIIIKSPGSSNLVINSIDPLNGVQGVYNAIAGIAIDASQALTINGGGYFTVSGPLFVSQSGLGSCVINGSSMIAGTISRSVINVGPTINPAAIYLPGSITIQSLYSPLNITNGSYFNSVGYDISVKSYANVSLNGVFQADGGNVSVLTLGSISGKNATITANAMGVSAASQTGGRIELGAGTLSSRLSSLSPVPGSLPYYPLYRQVAGPPLPLGSFIGINNNAGSIIPTGSVGSYTPFAGVVNLGTSSTTQLNLYGGGMMFSAQNSLTNVLLDGSILNTNGFSPISFKSSQKKHNVLDLEMPESNNGDLKHLAVVFVPGHAEELALTTHGIVQVSEREKLPAGAAPSEFVFRSGEMFLHAKSNTIIHADLADIEIRKGALVAINTEKNGLRIATCSGPGHVQVFVGKRSVQISAGEELLVSDLPLSDKQASKADGIGRRKYTHHSLDSGMHGSLCEISLLTVLQKWSQLGSAQASSSASARAIRDRVLKTAAALNLVTRSHGSFLAAPAEVNPRSDFNAVRFVSRGRLSASAQ